MLNSLLKEKHSDGQGTIMIDSSSVTLDLTASLIEEDDSTNHDFMVDQLLESDELRVFCRSMVGRKVMDVVISHLEIEKLAEKNLIELIESKLRSM